MIEQWGPSRWRPGGLGSPFFGLCGNGSTALWGFEFEFLPICCYRILQFVVSIVSSGALADDSCGYSGSHFPYCLSLTGSSNAAVLLLEGAFSVFYNEPHGFRGSVSYSRSAPTVAWERLPRPYVFHERSVCVF